MNRLVYAIPLFVVVVLVVFFALGLQRDPRTIDSVLLDQPVPAFDLAPIQGSERGFASADLVGEVSLINIFGSWCVACIAEHPFLMDLKRRDVVPVHGIDWREQNPADGPRWLEKHGNPYTLIGDDPESKAAIAFGVTGAPETFIIDKRGVIRYKFIGPMNRRAWDEILGPIVERLRRR